MRPRKCKSATVFSEVRRIAGTADDHLTIQQISEQLGKRSYGVILFILCLPNCIPAPPGLGSVFGLAMAAVVVQYLIGRDYPVLPRFIAERKISGDTLRRLVAATGPFMRRLETVIRPRELGQAQRFLEYLGMMAIAFLCVVILIPLPLTNMLPAMGAAVLAAAVAEKDAIGITFGLAIGAFGTAVAVKALIATVSLLM